MNLFLAISSLFHGIIILYSTKEKHIAFANNKSLVYLTYLGIITSIWNHSTTNKYALLVDRTLMYISFCYYLKKTYSHEMHIYNQRMVYQNAFMYLYAKCNSADYIQTILHIWTHMNVTYTYWRILVIEEKIHRIKQ